MKLIKFRSQFEGVTATATVAKPEGKKKHAAAAAGMEFEATLARFELAR